MRAGGGGKFGQSLGGNTHEGRGVKVVVVIHAHTEGRGGTAGVLTGGGAGRGSLLPRAR